MRAIQQPTRCSISLLGEKQIELQRPSPSIAVARPQRPAAHGAARAWADTEPHAALSTAHTTRQPAAHFWELKKHLKRGKCVHGLLITALFAIATQAQSPWEGVGGGAAGEVPTGHGANEPARDTEQRRAE